MKRIYLGLLTLILITKIDAQQYITRKQDINAKRLMLTDVKRNNYMRSDFLKILKTMFAPQIFIETGTYLGNNTIVASSIMSEVHSIEIEPKLYNAAVNRFKNQSKIKLYLGDSSTLLEEIIKETSTRGKLLFWLDGHFSAGNTGHNGTDTPILRELRIIKKSNVKDAIILINDVAYFRPSNPIDKEMRDYPSVAQVQKALYEINPDYYFVVYGDIMIAFPRSSGIIISAFLEALTASRLATEEVDDIELLLHFEQIIASAGKEDCSVIENLVKWRVGVSSLFYRFWRALMLMHTGKLRTAYDEFILVKSLGFPHWRIHWYLSQVAYQLGNLDIACEHLNVLSQLAPTFDLAFEFSKKISAIKR